MLAPAPAPAPAPGAGVNPPPPPGGAGGSDGGNDGGGKVPGTPPGTPDTDGGSVTTTDCDVDSVVIGLVVEPNAVSRSASVDGADGAGTDPVTSPRSFACSSDCATSAGGP